jgi:hypothetical protein
MEAQPLTINQAAARLGISSRAVQKRCANGTLAARRVSTPAGERWEVEGANLPANLDASWTRTDEPTGREPREPDAVLNSKSGRVQDANPRTIGREPDANTRELIAEKDARIEDLRAQIDAWRLQAEAANRTAAEASAALREALKAMPKAITAGNESAPIEAAQGDESTHVKETTPAAKQSPPRGAQARVLKPWQRAIMRMIGARA